MTTGWEPTRHIAFDFLGYTFRPRRAKTRRGTFFINFLPAISSKAAKAIRQTIRAWRMASTRNNQRLEDLARLVNPVVRGWLHYYGRYYRSACVRMLRHLNEALATWARRKYHAASPPKARVDALAGSHRAPGPEFVCPVASRWEARSLESKSRMKREFHVRFREGGGVQFPSATRHVSRCPYGLSEWKRARHSRAAGRVLRGAPVSAVTHAQRGKTGSQRDCRAAHGAARVAEAMWRARFSTASNGAPAQNAPCGALAVRVAEKGRSASN